MNMPNIPGYTAAELEDLTPDELASLENDPGDEGEEPAEPTAETAPVAEPVANVELDKESAESAAPAYVAVAPADAIAQLEALKQAKTDAKTEDRAALKKMMDGEIDFDEYQAIKTKSEDAIESANEAISDLNKASAKAEIASEMSQQESARAWAGEVGNLMTAAKTEGMDYKASDALTKELNGLVRAFGQEATENGMTDEGLKASKWALAQAHATMKMRHPEMVKAPAKTAAPNALRHNLTALNNMPNADRAMGDNDTLAKFGMLEGEAAERAMASMSAADIDKMLA